MSLGILVRVLCMSDLDTMNTAEIVSDMPHGASNKIKAIFELLIGCGFVIYEFLIGCVKKMS